ncbi:6005_t:CDS:2 [Cetraspora pellucida]|uniref:6005_t:CDS:1 n=1 Tax=Cetraspora pellucida TaxID=1433469 RepID=A0ACA9L525_9GLOM|nr:6005_t:CDS:2 [Cetraspora pellucida]
MYLHHQNGKQKDKDSRSLPYMYLSFFVVDVDCINKDEEENYKKHAQKNLSHNELFY